MTAYAILMPTAILRKGADLAIFAIAETDWIYIQSNRLILIF
jgi:hypothetical protein